MSLIRKLNNGKWNKPPVLTAARLVFAKGLAEKYPARELGDLADFVNGTSYDRGRLDMGDTPIIRISNITDPQSDFITTDEQFPERYHVSRGDLLVSWSASFKSVLWPGPNGILNQHIFKVTERNGHARSYIRHAIEAAFDEMQRNVVGMGMMHLRRGDFLGHRVPCPLPNIQRSVADYLDWVESGCDGKEPLLPEELAEQRRIVAKIARLAAQVDEAADIRIMSERKAHVLIRSRLREISEELGQPATLQEVLTGKPRNGWSAACDNGANGVPVLSLSAVTGYNFDPTAIKRTSLATDPSAHYWLKDGDLLITRSNTPTLVGHAAVYSGQPSPCIYPDLMMRIPVDPEKANTRFVWYWLQAPQVRDFIERNAKGTSPTMKKISQGTVMAIPFPKVSLQEQQRIVAELDGLQIKVDHVKGLQKKTAAELDALLPSILDRAFKGEL